MTVSTRSVAVVAFAKCAGELEADDLRHEHRDRLAEHRGLGFDPADAPAEHAEAVDHRRVRIGADERVRIGWGSVAVAVPASSSVVKTTRARYSRLTWWTMPVSGGTTRKFWNAFCPHRRKAYRSRLRVNSSSAFVRNARAVPASSTWTEWSIDELDRLERVDLLRVAPHAFHGVAHRGEVDDGRHAGEVLKQDAAGPERDFSGRFGLRVPGGQSADVVRGDGDAVLVAEQVFEEDFQRERQPRTVNSGGFQGVEAVNLVVSAIDVERRLGLKEFGMAVPGFVSGTATAATARRTAESRTGAGGTAEPESAPSVLPDVDRRLGRTSPDEFYRNRRLGLNPLPTPVPKACGRLRRPLGP